MKKVRIRKANPGETPGYYNKTSKFLHKAQLGGAPSIEQLSYPMDNQNNTEVTEDQLASLVVSDISNSRPNEEIVAKLVTVYGKDPMEATNFVNQIYTSLEQEQQALKEEGDEIDEEENKTEIEPGNYNEIFNEQIEDQEEEQPMVSDETNSLIYDDEEEDYSNEDQFTSDLIMMNGGLIKAQEGMDMVNQYPDYYQQYLPEQYLMENQMDENIEYPYMAAYTDDVYKNGGTYKKDKKSYVNSVLSIVKKQLGGDNDTNIKDQADPTGNNVRKNILSNYIGTLKSQSELAVAKEQAEQEFDNMVQQEALRQQQLNSMYEAGGIVNDPYMDPYGNLQRFVYGGNDMMDINQSDIDFTNSKDTTDGYLPQARRGKETKIVAPTGLSPNYYSKYLGARNSAGQSVLPKIDPNARIKSIDVHKTRWLSNAPKKYSITFTQGATDPSKQNLISLDKPVVTNQLSEKERARGDRQAGRQRPWYASKKYEQSFEEYDFTPEELQKLEELKARDAKNRDIKRKQGLDVLQKMNAPVKTNYSDQDIIDATTSSNGPLTEQESAMQNVLLQNKDITNEYTPEQLNYIARAMNQDPEGKYEYAPSTRQSTLVEPYSLEELQRQAKLKLIDIDQLSDNVTKIYNPSYSQESTPYIDPATLEGNPSGFKNFKFDETLKAIQDAGKGTAYGELQEYRRQKAFKDQGVRQNFLGTKYKLPDGTIVEYDENLQQFVPIKAYGGTAFNTNELKRFIPKAQLAGQTPISYSNNPAMQDTKFTSASLANMENEDWSNWLPKDNTVEPKRDISLEEMKMITDPKFSKMVDDVYPNEPTEDITLDFKTKKRRNVDPEASVNMFNAGVNAVSGFLDRRSQRDSQNRLSEELTSDNLYARTGAKDRGDYVDYGSQLGQFQFDKMGNDMNARYGGYMQEGGYTEGDEVEMTEEELRDFIANGGEVEYI